MCRPSVDIRPPRGFNSVMIPDHDSQSPRSDSPNVNAAALPDARPVGAMPAPFARPAERRGFPEIGMTRAAAGLDVLIISAFVIAIEFVVMAGGMTRYLMERFPSIDIFWGNAVMGAAILAALIVMIRLRGQGWSDVGLAAVRPGRVALGVLAAVPLCYAAVLIVVPLALTLIGTSADELIAERSEFFEEVPEIPPWTAAVFAMFVGLHEETLFRGFVLGRLQSLLRSNAGAIVASSFIFGGLHAYQGMVGVIQTTTVGLVLALLTVRMRTIWPAIIAHGFFDTLGLVLIPWVREYLSEYSDQFITTSAAAAAG
ncbi:MAG: hypothetical protein DCC65_17190 [Planctomycetota bacterium]|nr:MAG: hypothetical protein DCC65_17190 [Planctomycetota bacterium]